VGRMRGKQPAEQRFWNGVTELSGIGQEGGGGGAGAGGKRWDVLPMWTQGVEFVKADRQMAKDVMIMYTPDEGKSLNLLLLVPQNVDGPPIYKTLIVSSFTADPTVRLHYRAQFPPDTTPITSSDRLIFPMVKTRSRLRVTLSTPEDGVMSSRNVSPKEGELSDILDDVQEEAFDQEIFTAVSSMLNSEAILLLMKVPPATASNRSG
jgi:hypothetical protein